MFLKQILEEFSSEFSRYNIFISIIQYSFISEIIVYMWYIYFTNFIMLLNKIHVTDLL